MPPLLVAVADSVFPNLDPARSLSAIGADALASDPTSSEGILKIAAGADALLVTYAKITADNARGLAPIPGEGRQPCAEDQSGWSLIA